MERGGKPRPRTTTVASGVCPRRSEIVTTTTWSSTPGVRSALRAPGPGSTALGQPCPHLRPHPQPERPEATPSSLTQAWKGPHRGVGQEATEPGQEPRAASALRRRHPVTVPPERLVFLSVRRSSIYSYSLHNVIEFVELCDSMIYDIVTQLRSIIYKYIVHNYT